MFTVKSIHAIHVLLVENCSTDCCMVINSAVVMVSTIVKVSCGVREPSVVCGRKNEEEKRKVKGVIIAIECDCSVVKGWMQRAIPYSS